MTAHTPTPYAVAISHPARMHWTGTYSIEAKGVEIGMFKRREDAEFAQRACNSHDALVEALQAVMGEYREGYGLNCVERVRAALKAAGVAP